jgi:hypothetical protein
MVELAMSRQRILACHMQLTSYDLFFAPRVARQQGRICEIRPFTVTHYSVSNMEKGAAKIGYFQVTKQWLNVRSRKCTDELN